MKVTLKGDKSFSYIEAELFPNETIITESGAMASMDYGVDLKATFRGGFIQSILRWFFGKESLLINSFFNDEQINKKIIITKPFPGELIEQRIEPGNSFYIQKGSFVACQEGVDFKLSWAGFASWFAGEGLFRLKIVGDGLFWYGAYGSVIEKDIQGEYIVDTGHLLSYPPTVRLKIQLSGGIFSSFFGGEGLVARLEGSGKVRLQTRSIEGTASWLNPQFRK